MLKLDSFFIYSATAITVVTQPRILIYYVFEKKISAAAKNQCDNLRRLPPIAIRNGPAVTAAAAAPATTVWPAAGCEGRDRRAESGSSQCTPAKHKLEC